MRCEGCQHEYPPNLVQPFMSNGPTKFLCGICALAEKNRIHGTSDTSFFGGEAERQRLAAIRWREER